MFKILMNNDPISAPLYPIKEWPPFLYIDFIYTPVYFPPPPIKTIPNHTVDGSLSRLYCYRIWSNHWPLHWARTIGVIYVDIQERTAGYIVVCWNGLRWWWWYVCVPRLGHKTWGRPDDPPPPISCGPSPPKSYSIHAIHNNILEENRLLFLLIHSSLLFYYLLYFSSSFVWSNWGTTWCG